MNTKMNVLIPTDFTANAENALMYALQFLNKFISNLVLFHVYEPLEIGTEVPISEILEKEKEETQALIKSKMDISSTRAHKYLPDANIFCDTTEGDPAGKIIELAKKRDINLIISGYTTKSWINRLFWGNLTNKIIEKSPCPILLVPSDACFREIRNIVYASSLSTTDISKINQLSIIAEAFNASLHIVHIIPAQQKKENHNIQAFESETKKYVSYGKITFENISGKSAAHGIESYVQKYNTDLIAMSTRTRMALEQLYNPSITEKIASYTEIPMLIFHYDQED